jgi:hypothetical protein
MVRSEGRALLLALAIWVAGATAGCVVSRPPQNVGFGHATTLRDLEGDYVNLGEGHNGKPSIHLSEIIWPRDSLRHEAISTIEVRAPSDSILVLRAIGAGGDTVRTSRFTRGTQFELREGHVHLKSISGAVAPDAEGSAFLGAGSETVELGIDIHGDAKYKSTMYFAGVAFLVVPVAGGGLTEVRFRRITK